jgi:hypothetical protein
LKVMATTSWLVAVVAVGLFFGVLTFGVWAARRHDRMFPHGRPEGWEPGERRSFETMWAWLSGGRGGG